MKFSKFYDKKETNKININKKKEEMAEINNSKSVNNSNSSI